jgi:hypothetical protein
MDDRIKKRKARDQLSPYTSDMEVESSVLDCCDTSAIPPQRRARARRSVESNGDKQKLGGLFTGISLSAQASSQAEEQIKNQEETDEWNNPTKKLMMVNLNASFLKSLETVVNTQADKDLRYLFTQYKKYIASIIKTDAELDTK